MLETGCEVREVERCEEGLEEECSLVEEVVPECRDVERQECRAVSLLIGPDTIFTRMGSVLANRAGYSIT